MLPAELYECIIGHLDHNHDRETLLSAAQSCTLLRMESQRILFRSTAGEIWYGADQIHRHRMFLEAVLSAPERLALYVREFEQLAVGWEPRYLYETGKDVPDFEARIRVYELTRQALPLMNNLKRLCFSPFRANPSGYILRQCSFQLNVFEWWQARCEDELVSSFFPRQNELRHIKVFWRSDRMLPRNILPRLVSVQGSLLSLVLFVESVGPGKILAFEYRNTTASLDQQLGVQRTMEALSSLKYICIPVEYSLGVITQGNRLPESIILIQITLGANQNLAFLQYASLKLRALVLRGSDSFRYTLSQSKMALTAFMQCPSLQYVEFHPLDSTRTNRILRQSHLAGELNVKTFTVFDRQPDWWKRHFLDDS